MVGRFLYKIYAYFMLWHLRKEVKKSEKQLNELMNSMDLGTLLPDPEEVEFQDMTLHQNMVCDGKEVGKWSVHVKLEGRQN